MFEVHVSTPNLDGYLKFIAEANPDLTILLHEDTGQDLRDHTENVKWIGGDPLPLDFNAFTE